VKLTSVLIGNCGCAAPVVCLLIWSFTISDLSSSKRNEGSRQAVREEIRAAGNGNGHALLTAEELSKALKVNKATVYEWVKAKTIPYYQAGRFVRFNLQEVLESQRKKNENPY
jgi:excisionase family DNA binding protein